MYTALKCAALYTSRRHFSCDHQRLSFEHVVFRNVSQFVVLLLFYAKQNLLILTQLFKVLANVRLQTLMNKPDNAAITFYNNCLFCFNFVFDDQD